VVNNQLQRGVFSLGHSFSLPKASKFSHWKVAKFVHSVNSVADIKQISNLLLPWLKAKSTNITDTDEENTHNKLAKTNKQVAQQSKPIKKHNSLAVFDFESYLLNQGSAELALYMLDDYIAENSALVTELTQALALDKLTLADDLVASLLLNGKILAATELVTFCYHWQTLLAEKRTPADISSSRLSSENSKHDNTALQAKLLSKTKAEVLAIAQYAQAL